MNLPYRFMLIPEGAGAREAADPVVIRFDGRYYLFASKSGGYWHTTDFAHWTHVPIADDVLPIEDYAPALFVQDGWLYYVGSTPGEAMLYRSNAPERGVWEAVTRIPSHWDPAFWAEGDNLYIYYGSSPSDPIRAVTLDLATFRQKAAPVDCLDSDTAAHGWERPGERHELKRRPYIEGAWMTAHGGKYYLQYAGPGTEWKSYADGVYVGTSPTGPFRYQAHNPTSAKEGGFICGAGHGCLFDVEGQWWKAATNSISVKHPFERRVSFYPSGFDEEGYLWTDTYAGDYPLWLPGHAPVQHSTGPEWELLSLRRPVRVSSALEGHPAERAVDEEARTEWVAATAGEDEWLEVDLGEGARVAAVQVNFDEYGSQLTARDPQSHQHYLLEASHNGKRWTTLVDNSEKENDTPHDYIEFREPFEARYIRVRNLSYTSAPYFSLRDLRVFGRREGEAPASVADLSVERHAADGCRATVRWTPTAGAEGYVIRYGIAPDKLYSALRIPDGKVGEREMTGLNRDVPYWFAVDAFNGSGTTRGSTTGCR
ncbi:discoidin domain-containing protein [uncultured Rikenella sp.]|uniref:discoidin domain-containing protein n=1 Tax=uncultured Rikenella sp. TaxID=368003 RepID=UPI0026226C07|nr:discoidin domain-containing protein [uncultured Rikenella sp.]